jgi:YD repeat-containing protein
VGTSYATGVNAPILRSVTYPDGRGNIEYVHREGFHTIFGDPHPFTHAEQVLEIRVNGQPLKKYTYQNPYGHGVLSSEYVDGTERFTYAYGADDTRVVTNPYGHQTTYKFENRRITEVTGAATAHCASTFKANFYDEDGMLEYAVDERDVMTRFEYDSLGRQTRMTEAVGEPEERVTSLEWDTVSPANPLGTELLRSVTIPGHRKTSYTYTVDNPNRASLYSSVTVRNLSPNGVANQDRVTTFAYTYWASGLVSSVTEDGPIAGSNDRVIRRYNAFGDLVSVENSLGHKRTYSGHNGFGQPARIVEENGEMRDLTYDARGRIETETTYFNGVAKTVRYVYDAFGRLARVSKPYGRDMNILYDSVGRVTARYEQVAPGRYGFEANQYDAASNRQHRRRVPEPDGRLRAQGLGVRPLDAGVHRRPRLPGWPGRRGHDRRRHHREPRERAGGGRCLRGFGFDLSLHVPADRRHPARPRRQADLRPRHRPRRQRRR